MILQSLRIVGIYTIVVASIVTITSTCKGRLKSAAEKSADVTDTATPFSPDQPGDNTPAPKTASLFDVAMTSGGKTSIPFPIEDLIAKLEATTGAPAIKVMIPASRSLQRLASTYKFPRLVFATQSLDAPAADSGRKIYRSGTANIYVGYSEWAKEVEIISWNPWSGRYEFQVIHNYTKPDQPVFYASRDVCVQCHQNHAPIFPDNLWSETNGSRSIARKIEAARGSSAAYHGIPVYQNDGDAGPISEAFDGAARKSNATVISQYLWLNLCGTDDAGASCRLNLTKAAMSKMCFNDTAPAETIEKQLAALWAKKFPKGVTFQSSVIHDREPLNLMAPVLPVAALPTEAGERPPPAELFEQFDPESRDTKSRSSLVKIYLDLGRRQNPKILSSLPVSDWLMSQLVPYKTLLCAVPQDLLLSAVDGLKNQTTLFAGAPFQAEQVTGTILNQIKPGSFQGYLPEQFTTTAPVDEANSLHASDPIVDLFITNCARCHQTREPVLKLPEANLIRTLKSATWKQDIFQRLNWLDTRSSDAGPPQSAMPRRSSSERKAFVAAEHLKDHCAMLDYVKPDGWVKPAICP